MTLGANPGERIDYFLRRATALAKVSACSPLRAVHNNISINVYADSVIHDLLEKFDYASQLAARVRGA